MAKIIDPDNYVPHNLPIPGTWKERDEFDKMIREMRGESHRASKESCE